MDEDHHLRCHRVGARRHLRLYCILHGRLYHRFRQLLRNGGRRGRLSTGSNFQVRHDDPMNVEVKYVFASASDEASGYSVKIVPNIVKDKDFDFRLNGDVYSFQAEKDLTAGFIIEQEENSFTLTPKGDITAILSAVYPGYNVEDCSDKGYENMFTLIVTSYNGEASIRVNFTVTEDIEGVIIDKEVIEF